MAKKPSITSSMRAPKPGERLPAAKPAQAAMVEQRIGIVVPTPKSVHRRLKIIAMDHDVTLEALMLEGVDLLLERYGRE